MLSFYRWDPASSQIRQSVRYVYMYVNVYSTVVCVHFLLLTTQIIDEEFSFWFLSDLQIAVRRTERFKFCFRHCNLVIVSIYTVRLDMWCCSGASSQC